MPAVLLGDRDPEQPELLHLLDDRLGELVLVVVVLGLREDLLVDELTDHLRDGLLLVGLLQRTAGWPVPCVSVPRVRVGGTRRIPAGARSYGCVGGDAVEHAVRGADAGGRLAAALDRAQRGRGGGRGPRRRAGGPARGRRGGRGGRCRLLLHALLGHLGLARRRAAAAGPVHGGGGCGGRDRAATGVPAVVCETGCERRGGARRRGVLGRRAAGVRAAVRRWTRVLARRRTAPGRSVAATGLRRLTPLTTPGLGAPGEQRRRGCRGAAPARVVPSRSFRRHGAAAAVQPQPGRRRSGSRR